MIANRFNPLGRKPKPTAKSYIQDGLIAHWDALENIGYGKRDATAKVWRDLISGTDMIGTDGVEWGDNFYLGQTYQWFQVDLTSRQDITDSYNSGQFTIEVVLSVDPNLYPSTGYPFFMGANYSDNAMALYCRANGRFGGWFVDSSFNYDRPTANVNPRTLTFIQDLKNQKYDIFENGIRRAGKTATSIRQALGSTLFIGRNVYVGGDNRYFQGCIHNIRWSNRAISTDEMSINRQIDLERFGV